METITINLEQLELLRDPKNYPLLQLLETPHNPSEAAKKFGLAPNALHHRFKKLAKAKLLKEVSQRGNRRTYQVVAMSFKIHKKHVPDAETLMPNLYKENLQLVQKYFVTASEKYFTEAERDENKPYLFAHLRTRMMFTDYKPAMFIREVELTSKQYSELADLIRDFLKEALKTNHTTNEKHTKTCTITYIACEGGAISGKTN
jgi:DNA-binding Lrp family transcriptional regulator